MITDDQIIEMAKLLNAFFHIDYDNGNSHEGYEFDEQGLFAFARLIESRTREELQESVEDSKRLDWLDAHNESHEIRVDVDCYWYISPRFAKSAVGYPFIRGAIDAAAIRNSGGAA